MAKMKNSVVLCCLLFSTALLSAQEDEKESIFRAAVILGFNATQVDGDDLAGYKKFGANAGGAAYILLPKNFSVNFEILYSQKGSRADASPNLPSSADYKLILDYVDVPLVFNYHDRDKSGKEIAIFGLGFAFNSLVRQKQLINGGDCGGSDCNSYKRTGFEVLANMTFVFAKHFGINLRYSYSITDITSEPVDYSNLKNGGQRNNVLSMRGMYFF